MKISNKQIMQLVTIAHAYTSAMHRMGEYRNFEEVQTLLADINDQQSDELRDISDE